MRRRDQGLEPKSGSGAGKSRGVHVARQKEAAFRKLIQPNGDSQFGFAAFKPYLVKKKIRSGRKTMKRALAVLACIC
ncbi:MAG: hypothetical protein WBE54_17070, partial [Bradyrhizobium sp.]